MKILLLNPHIDAEHKIAAALRSKGFAVLVAGDTEEAWQACQLHGTSLDLAVIHREWGKAKDGGIRFVEKLRTDPVQADLPFILTSEDWSEVECAIHQKSANGANAYLRWPFTENALLDVIQKIFPDSLLPAGKAEQTLTNTNGPKVSDLNTIALAGAEPGLAVEAATNASQISLSQGVGVGVLPPGAPFGAPGGPPPFGAPMPPSSTAVAIGEGSVPALEFTSPQMSRPVDPQQVTRPPMEPTSPNLEAGTGLVLEDVSSLIAKPNDTIGDKPSSIVLDSSIQGAGGAALSLDATSPPVNLDATSPSGFGEGGTQATRALPSQGTQGIDLGGGTETKALPTGANLSHEPALDLSSVGLTAPSMESPAPKIPKRPVSFQQTAPAPGEGTSELGTIAVNPSGLPQGPAYDIKQDQEVAQQMPYLFGKTMGAQGGSRPASPIPALLGDAIIPGAAGTSPDVETLKQYLTLREHDVAVLSAQLRAMQDRIDSLEKSIEVEKAQSAELLASARSQKQKIAELERARGIGDQQLQTEVEELKFQLKMKSDQARILEARTQEGSEEMERLKERVRSDIRKIRVHERELENRLEVLKRDSEALIGARETKIIELKRKLDLLEFNMDLLQNQFSREKDTTARLRDRLAKAAQIVRVAGGLLDAEGKAALAKITGAEAPSSEELAAFVAGAGAPKPNKGRQAS